MSEEVNTSTRFNGAQHVEQVQQSWGSFATAWLPIITPPLLAIFGVLKGLPPFYQTIIFVSGMVVGAWLWNESKKRQSQTQHQLIAAASDPNKTTVTLTPPAEVG